MMIFLLLPLINAGIITPKTLTPVLPAYNNAYYISDYSFYFQIETYMPEESTLQITFPSTSYISGLGISSCQAEDMSGNPLSCSISGTIVIIYIGEISNKPSDNNNLVVLKNVRNPNSMGSTGMFKIETY